MKRILAATDGSEHGRTAVMTGAGLARRSGAGFDVVTVVEVVALPPDLVPPGIDASEHELEFIREAREAAEQQAREAGVTEPRIHVRAGLAPQLVNRVAEDIEADLIVVGANPEPALARSLVGSTGRRIVYLAQRPVLVANEARNSPFRRVLAAVDLSEESPRVLEVAWSVAEADGGQLRALHVVEPLPKVLLRAGGPDDVDRRRQRDEQLAGLLGSLNVDLASSATPVVREGHAGREILGEAQDQDADLIVVGTHGHGFFDRLLLGSTSLYVLRHGQRATLMVPRRAQA